MFIQAYRWRMDEQARGDLWHAWHTAALAGANFSRNGMPPLSRVLPERASAPKRPLTVDQERDLWMAWAQDHNRSLRRDQ